MRATKVKNLIINSGKTRTRRSVLFAVTAVAVLMVAVSVAAWYFSRDNNEPTVTNENQEVAPVNEATAEEQAQDEKRNQEARAMYQSALDVINSDSPNESELTNNYVTAAYYAAFFNEDQAKDYAIKALEKLQPPDLENHPGPEEERRQLVRNYEETRKDMELIRDGQYEQALTVISE